MSPLILLYIALVLMVVIFGSLMAWRSLRARRTDPVEGTGPLPRAGPSFDQASQRERDRER